MGRAGGGICEIFIAMREEIRVDVVAQLSVDRQAVTADELVLIMCIVGMKQFLTR